MQKTYVLDTNVLLHNPESLYAFEDNHIVIPFAVIEELDNQKRRPDEVGRHARIASRRLDALRQSGSLSEGVALPGGGSLRVELNHHSTHDYPPGLSLDKYDNRILAVAYNLAKESKGPVITVTKDLNLRIKADVLGMAAQNFTNDMVNYSNLYQGVREIQVTAEDIETFYRSQGMAWEADPPLLPHEFVILKNAANPSQSAIAKFSEGMLVPLHFGDTVNWGVKARNKEQKFALELLLDDSVRVVTLVGTAGTGKTLLALAVGLEKVVEQNAYSRFLITRPVTPVGEDLGYLPGSKEEKLKPWMQAVYDNLEYLCQRAEEPRHVIEELVSRGVLDMDTLTYLRGRSIPRQFILCDEAQNITPKMIKTLVTRVGEGSKIVFTGDPEQIDHPYLDQNSNGLTYLVERIKEQEVAGHVTLVRGERSAVAEMGAKLL
ncbi:MAG: PhoH family protein [Desulfatibacillum sp.]|nr:PhoH family protein [Desulfatibacillum sp.]